MADKRIVTVDYLNSEGLNKDYIHNNFANALKGSKSGSAFLIDDVSPVTHEMDVKVRGKNLIPYPYATSSGSEINGITWTVNEDGSITANGTATGNSNFVVISQANPIAIAGKTVTLSGCPTGGSSTTYGIYYYDTVTSQFDYGNGVTFISKGVVSVNIRIYGGATVDNLVFKPQLELGTTATAYTPYVPDLTAVKVNTYGKNFIDINSIANDIVKKNPTSCEITDFDGKRCLKLGTTSTIKYTIQTLIPLYGLQLKVYSTGYSAGFMGYTKNDTGTSVIYITVSDENEWVNIKRYYPAVSQYYTEIRFYKTDVTKPIYIDLDSVMLEASHTATEYEPYKGAEYTPTADGVVNGVTSLYPSTTLATDTDGVLIDCEYNRDINKAFAELQAAIISSGGNV